MALYTGSTLGLTPTAGTAVWYLVSVSGVEAMIKEVTFGGEVTTSTAMRARLTRDSALGTGALTGSQVQKGDQHSLTNTCSFGTTFATLQGTASAGCIWGTSWNAHGGVVRWLSDPTYLITVYDAGASTAEVELRNDVGTAVSSYSVLWVEV